MSLSNSSSWFRTGARATEKKGEKDRERERWSQGKEMWSQADRYSQRKRERRHRCRRIRDQENDRSRQKRRQLGKKKCQVKKQRDQITQRTDGEREGRKREYGEKGDREDIGKHGGRELSEHPMWKRKFAGVGDDGEEIVRRRGRW